VPGNIRAGARAGRSTKRPQKRMMQANVQGMIFWAFELIPSRFDMVSWMRLGSRVPGSRTYRAAAFMKAHRAAGMN
jgi:hypothetical protein